jgi:hypothetical protein
VFYRAPCTRGSTARIHPGADDARGPIQQAAADDVLLGGKDIERRPDSATATRVIRVRAFGLIGGVRVRIAG